MIPGLKHLTEHETPNKWGFFIFIYKVVVSFEASSFFL